MPATMRCVQGEIILTESHHLFTSKCSYSRRPHPGEGDLVPLRPHQQGQEHLVPVARVWVMTRKGSSECSYFDTFTFSLADVRCVCKNEDKCNNLEKPGRSNRRNSGYRLEAGPLLVLAALASLTR